MLSASQLGRESELSDDQALRCTFCKRFVKYKGSIGTIRYCTSISFLEQISCCESFEINKANQLKKDFAKYFFQITLS